MSEVRKYRFEEIEVSLNSAIELLMMKGITLKSDVDNLIGLEDDNLFSEQGMN